MPVTYKDVESACERLLPQVGSHERVTCRMVIAEVGGSMSTIAEHLRNWKNRQKGEIPPELQKLWVELREHVDAENAPILQEADEAIADAKARVHEKELALVQVNQALREAEQRERDVRAQAADLQQQLGVAQAGAAERERALGQQLEDQRAAADRQVQDLREKFAEAGQQLAGVQRQAQELQQRLAVVGEQLVQAQRETAHHQELARAAAGREAEQTRQLEEVRTQGQALLQQLDQVRGDLVQRDDQVAQLREALAKAKAEAEERTQQLAQAREHGQVRSEVQTLRDRIEHLISKLDPDGAPAVPTTTTSSSGKKPKAKASGSA